MLTQLHIQNLAVIHNTTINLTPGLNTFTGETGAGKSLILSAFEILLGLKKSKLQNMIRQGQPEARITGLFEIKDPNTIQKICDTADLPSHDSKNPLELLVTRKILPTGRTTITINTQPATTAIIKVIGQYLVDIHGQHDHQNLLKTSNQLQIIDAFANAGKQKTQYQQTYSALNQAITKRDEIFASQTLRHQQIELYKFQLTEIQKADPQHYEFEETQAEHKRLQTTSQIKQSAYSIYQQLYEDHTAIITSLQSVKEQTQELLDLDTNIKPQFEQIKTALITLQDTAYDISRYNNSLEYNPANIKKTESRLNTLNSIISKFCLSALTLPFDHNQVIDKQNATALVIAYAHRLKEEIQNLQSQDQSGIKLAKEIQELRDKLKTQATSLTKLRNAAIKKLAPLVENELAQLGMPEAKFIPTLVPNTPNNPFTLQGKESAQILIQANPGQPPRPIGEVASGGELSRVMLAIKSIIASNHGISVLVFDEIDANIGGRLGTVIGEKLKKLANPKQGPKHQIVCITHLPQIAAFADNHLHITKAVTTQNKVKETTTTVINLKKQERIKELSQMLAGKDATKTTEKQIKEMIAAAS